MIEVERSRTGLPILKSAGRHLSSSYDPVLEAQSWLESVLVKIKNFDQILVLGLGSAYHCMALLKAVPEKSIRIIERDTELACRSLDLFVVLQQVPLSLFHEACEILHSPEIGKLLENNIYVLRMPSTRFFNQAFFDEAALCLNARRPQDFKKVCELRGEFYNQMDFKKINSAKLISINEFSWLEGEARLTSERRAFLLLKELIK